MVELKSPSTVKPIGCFRQTVVALVAGMLHEEVGAVVMSGLLL